jgi:hypothetical protein
VMPFDRMLEGTNDFAHWYIGGLLFGTPDLHSAAVNKAKQIELIGAVLLDSYFIRPTFYGFFLKPLTLFPYMTAYWLWQLMSLAGFAVFLKLHSRDYPDLKVLAPMSAPLIANFVNGQDVILLLVFACGSLLLARKGRDLAAGALLTLCAIKFHLFLFVPVAVLLHGRKRIFQGGLLGGAVLAAITLLGGGIQATMMLLELLRNPQNHPYPHLMPNLRGLTHSVAGENVPIYVFLILLVSAATIYLIRKADSYQTAFGYCLVAGLLVNFHSYIQDGILLLLAAALLMPVIRCAYARGLLVLSLTPVPYMLLHFQPPFSGTLPLLLVLFLVVSAVRAFSLSRQAESEPVPAAAEV